MRAVVGGSRGKHFQILTCVIDLTDRQHFQWEDVDKLSGFLTFNVYVFWKRCICAALRRVRTIPRVTAKMRAGENSFHLGARRNSPTPIILISLRFPTHRIMMPRRRMITRVAAPQFCDYLRSFRSEFSYAPSFQISEFSGSVARLCRTG